jgi:serine/threonine protein kinase
MTGPPPTSAFFDVLVRSQLVERRQLARYVEGLAPGEALEPPGGLARRLVDDGLLTRFQADQLLRGKYLGFFVGPYKVLWQISSGTVAAVYACEHVCLRRRAAVKVLFADHAQNPRALERFYREARAAAVLDHPNLVRAYDAGQHGRLHYLAMEHVDGVSLKRLVGTRGPLRHGVATECLRQAAVGLQHAHEAGLVHRDLRPSNLMMARAGVVKILGLGLARFRQNGGDTLTQGEVLGEAAYIAPEQVLDSHAVDVRADIYGLGATFYFCLTGRPPGGGQAGAAPEPPPGGPADLLDVLLRMLAVDPGQRYQTPAEVVEAVARLGRHRAGSPAAPAHVAGPRAHAPRPGMS